VSAIPEAIAVPAVVAPSQRGANWRLLAYALPTAASGTVAAPVAAILPSLYAKYAAVSLTALGTLFVVLRVFDAVSDPLIGYWSDRTRSVRWGRKPWIVAGGACIAVSVYFLFRIPADATIVYMTLWAMLFYLGYTMHEVPHMAWGSEITPDYAQRAKLFSYRSMADTAGALTYTVLPLGLFYGGFIATTDYTPEVFHWLGIAALILLPLLIGIAVRYAPTGEVGPTQRSDVRGLLGSLVRNKPLARFLAAYLVAGAGAGIYGALFFPYFDSYLHIGDKVPHLFLVALIFQFISQPFWARVVALIGKHRTWGWGWIANSVVLLPMLLVQPGPGAVLPVLVLTALYCFTNGVSSVAPFALLADVVDYEMLKRRVDRAGNYYALLLFMAKVTGSVGGLVFVFLGAVFGYQIADGAVNSHDANQGMVISFCVLPSLFQILAVPLIWNFPIDQRRHAIIRKRLAQREAREARA
jgi:GPH family glycoside/pentoside/hexuronide:cation symporter